MVPAFDTVRVEKTGEAVIAGTSEPGADVVVKYNGEEIGKTTANDEGAFVVVPDKPLMPGTSGAITIESKGKDDAAPTASEQSVAVIVPAAEEKKDALVALVSPDQPTKVLQKADTQTAAAEPVAPVAETKTEPAAETNTEPVAETKTEPVTPALAKPVGIDAVDYDAAGNIVFSGSGEPGSTARLYVDNAMVGDAVVGPDGRWTFSGTAKVEPGVHKLRVDAVDAAGKVLSRIEVPFFREEQKTVADATPPETPPAATETKTDATKTEPEPAAPATTDAGGEQPAVKTDSGATTPPAVGTGEQPADATPPKPKVGRVVIQPGNNLWRISRVLYGKGEKYTVLYEANKDQIRNPDLIYPGQIFQTPDVAPKAESVDPKRREPLTPEENAAGQ